MEADHGALINEQTGVFIGVNRYGAKWSVDLDDLAAASASIPDLENHADLQRIVQAKAVISLHERMGHANAEAMCDALGGDSPS